MIVVGIDGGGTSTRAALVGGDGATLGVGRAGPSNYDDVGVTVAQANIAEAVMAAWQAAGRAPEPLAAAFLGMAGVVSDADRATIRGMALALDLASAARIGVDHDIRIALAGGLGGREGIALIVGTGSSCYGRRDDGRDWRAGGWGHLLDDVGSGYYLGLHGLMAVVRAVDGRGPTTVLVEPMLRAVQLADPQGIMRRVYHEGMTRAEMAALAPLVLDAAVRGDGVARRIMDEGVDELALMVATVARTLEFPPNVAVTAVGGLAESGPAFQEPLVAAIRRRLPGASIQEPQHPPVYGAALLALGVARLD